MVISNMCVCRESYDFCTKILINFEICIIDRLVSIERGGLLLSVFIKFQIFISPINDAPVALCIVTSIKSPILVPFFGNITTLFCDVRP